MERESAVKVGFALTGSFCTFSKALECMRHLIALGYDLYPVMSETSYTTDTRFGRAEEFIEEIETMCGRKIIHTIPGAEPIGPKKMFDILLIAPCTGNTLGKMACGITDTAVTMAAKSHLRNGSPVLIAVSTNDALGGSAKNIGQLFNRKHIYFVPMKQDNPQLKPTSIVADFSRIPDAIESALEERQLQPMML